MNDTSTTFLCVLSKFHASIGFPQYLTLSTTQAHACVPSLMSCHVY